jgi:predicted RNA-binding protein YlxR (DUF448 family)
MCAGCRERAPRSALLRIARAPDGTVRVDLTGHAPGRGGYVHRRIACVEAAVARGGLARALRAGVPPDEVGRLRELTRENG